MANVLYITCNVRPKHRSRTLSLGCDFLLEYLRNNPCDEVEFLDLYRDCIQRVDEDVLNAWERSECGADCAALTDDERRKVIRLWRLADQFARCEKYVFVTHSLNLWLPAEFKMYIDAICAPGRTYRLTPEGATGTLPDRCRKALHLHAVPSFAFGPDQDMSIPYLRSVLNFLGVTHQETVLLHGDDPERGDNKEFETAQRTLLGLAHGF